MAIGLWGWGCEPSILGKRRCILCVYIDLITYTVLIHQRYRRTDGRTDDVQSQYRALHRSASRDKNARKRRAQTLHSAATQRASLLNDGPRPPVPQLESTLAPRNAPKTGLV